MCDEIRIDESAGDVGGVGGGGCEWQFQSSEGTCCQYLADGSR